MIAGNDPLCATRGSSQSRRAWAVEARCVGAAATSTSRRRGSWDASGRPTAAAHWTVRGKDATSGRAAQAARSTPALGPALPGRHGESGPTQRSEGPQPSPGSPPAARTRPAVASALSHAVDFHQAPHRPPGRMVAKSARSTAFGWTLLRCRRVFDDSHGRAQPVFRQLARPHTPTRRSSGGHGGDAHAFRQPELPESSCPLFP